MDIFILWGLFILGLLLLFFSLGKQPLTHWLLIYFMNAYFSTFIGVFVVEEKMLEYPVKFLSDYFDTSLLFEYLLFPVVSIYFYQTTYHSKLGGVITLAFLYSATLTGIEVLFERYTGLIEYHTWTWMYSFLGMFLLILVVRGIMELVRRVSKEG